MNKPGTRSQRTNRCTRLMVEALEWRRMCSATPLTLLSGGSTVSVTQVVAGAGHLAVDNSGGLWYTAGDSLLAVAASGTTQYAVPPASDGSARPIVSNVVFTQDNSAWFVVAEHAGDRLERMTAGGSFADVTPVTDATIGKLTVSQDGIWFTQSTPAAAAIGHVDTGGGAALIYVPGGVTFAGLATGPDGNVWFTGNADGQGVVGKVMANGSVQEQMVAGTVGDIINGHDGSMYFGGANGIWQASMSGNVSMRVHGAAAPQSLTESADGSLWFIDASHPAYPISHVALNGVLLQYGSGIEGTPVPSSLMAAPDGGIWFTAVGSGAGWLGDLQASNSDAQQQSQGIVTSVILSNSNANFCLCAGVTTAFIYANGVPIIVQRNTSGIASDNNTQTDPPVVTTSVSTRESGAPTPPSDDRHLSGVYVVTLSAVANGNDEKSQNPGTNQGNVTQDPGTFEGEFSVHVPMGRTLPPLNAKHSYYSSSKTAAPALVPAVGQTLATVASGGPAVPGACVLPPGQAQGQPVVFMQSSYINSAKTPSSTATDTPGQVANEPLVDWWRFTAMVSAASGLQSWWPFSSRQMYW